MGARQGTMILAGTPGRYRTGLWWSCTDKLVRSVIKEDKIDKKVRRVQCLPWRERDQLQFKEVKPAWSLHTWETKDNKACPWIWDDFLAQKDLDGTPDDDPVWRREYLAEYVDDPQGYCSAYCPVRDDYDDELPPGHEWQYIISIDPGLTHDTGIVVQAWSTTCPNIYIVDEYSAPTMDIATIGAKLDELKALYSPCQAMVGDPAGAIYWAELRKLGHNVQKADKLDKLIHAEIMDSAFRSSKLKVHSRCTKLKTQLTSLQWVLDKQGRITSKVNDQVMRDDLFHAGLYGHRYLNGNSPRGQLKRSPQEMSINEYWADQESQMEQSSKQNKLINRFGYDPTLD
jgi:hypothetical protein